MTTTKETTKTTNMNNSNKKKSVVILGQDMNVVMALIANIVSWFIHTYLSESYRKKLLVPKKLSVEIEVEQPTNENFNKLSTNDNTQCIVISQPGGIEQLRTILLKDGIMTCGYNMANTMYNNQPIPFTHPILSKTDIPLDTVIIIIHALSINYADCCIRWGLYESANQYVGYPIIPGFDFSGIIEQSNSSLYKPGDIVYGCTLFGSYSTRVLVPANQIQKIPKLLSSVSTSTTGGVSNKDDDNNNDMPLALTMVEAAAIPAVALTSLYALYLAGHYHPLVDYTNTKQQKETSTETSTLTKLFFNNSILIHSAGGGVGSMLVQMSKILQLYPIVGIVGKSNKVQYCIDIGCDIVIDKSLYKTKAELWKAIANANLVNNGLYSTIMDCNGIDTLQYSYNALSTTGRLIIFGFHTNLPMNASNALNPIQWMSMITKMIFMPVFNPMDLVSSNKSVLGFNLSFFDKEIIIVQKLFTIISYWISTQQLIPSRIIELAMPTDVSYAHELIQSGTTVGKIVLTTKYYSK